MRAAKIKSLHSPELGSDLVTALASLDVDDLTARRTFVMKNIRGKTAGKFNPWIPICMGGGRGGKVTHRIVVEFWNYLEDFISDLVWIVNRTSRQVDK